MIGKFSVEGKAALAPLAGVADRAFRTLCRAYGAAYTVSEMTSAKGVSLGDRKSAGLLLLTDDERPAGVQLFGDAPEAMAAATEKALQSAPDFIDINMGCPAPKVVCGGSGAAMMKNPENAAKVTAAVVKAAGTVPVTVKMRAGWEKDSINAVELAKMCEAAGAAAITVHGRTRAQMYAPPVNFGIIRAVREAVRIPVIGNGDVTDGLSAARLLEETGCAMVLVGRGSLGRPWVFSQINAYLDHGALLPEPPVSECMRVMLSHVQKICEYKGENIGIREARKHAAWYVRDMNGAAKFRARLSVVCSLEELTGIAYEIVSNEAVTNS